MEPQAGAIGTRRGQLRHTAQLFQDRAYLVGTHHEGDREDWCLCIRCVLDDSDFLPQHHFVQEDYGAEGLILSRRRDMLFDREPRKKRRHVTAVELTRVACAVKHDIPPDPMTVRGFSTPAVMPA